MENLKEYKDKRNFKKTSEPVGKKQIDNKKRFCVQHHLARKDHYDLRLEYKEIMLSFAIPKGPSYNPKDKRLAVHVENHPISYRNFEGIIPEGEYGAGTVMLWDKGTFKEIESFNKTYKLGYLKFILKGKKLKGAWLLTKYKDDNWLLIKEKDGIKVFDDINELPKSIKTNRTMTEIAKKKEDILKKITITNPDKILYKKTKTTKLDVINYYNLVKERMMPYIKNRIISTVRMPNNDLKNTFFKKHFKENKYLRKVPRKNYYYINDELGLLNEVQLNSIEFHIGSSTVNDNYPNYMVFDLDPDESLNIKTIRDGVKDLKSILDELKLKSFLKTSGGKGYHVVVPFKMKITRKRFEKIAYDIAKLMETKKPEKYTTNLRKKDRHKKIFIDYLRNIKNSTSIAPYSLRARKIPTVSMPIKWSELDRIKPNDITIKDAVKRLSRKDPWEDFF